MISAAAASTAHRMAEGNNVLFQSVFIAAGLQFASVITDDGKPLSWLSWGQR